MSGKQSPLTRYAGIQVQTSSLGLQIPVGWGTFRCKCNLMDYLDFKATAQKASGKGGSVTTGYSYKATIILAICEGPSDNITTVFVDGKAYIHGSTYSGYADTSSQSALAQASLSWSTGAIGQTPWSYLTTSHPAHAIGYSGLTIAYAENYNLDSGASTPNHSFEVVRGTSYTVPPIGGGAGHVVIVSGTPDADPSLILADFFLNTRTGVPLWVSGLLDPVSIVSATNSYQKYCLASGLLVSPVIDSERTASDFLTELLLATNSNCVWSEGLLKLIPYGDTAVTGNGVTYTPNLTPVYSLDDDNFIVSKGSDALLVDIQDQSDAYNAVQFEYIDRTNQYNMAIAYASDSGNVAEFGERRKDPDTVHVICTPTVANLSAQLWLQRTLYVRSQYKFKLGWMFAILEPGDLVELTDAGLGLDAYPVRIIQVDEDEKYGLSFIAEDLLVGVSHAPLYVMQNSVASAVNTATDPGGVETNLALWSGDQTAAVYTKQSISVTANAANDQYGLNTADALGASTGAGTPAQLGTNTSSATSTTIALTTTADSPAGNMILVWVGASTGTVTSVTDSAGNTYTAGTSLSTPVPQTLRPFWCLNAAHLPLGGTITATVGTSTASKYVGASSVSGVLTSGALDVQGAGTSSTGTSPSISTGTLAQAAEIIQAGIYIGTGASDTYTQASGFTANSDIILSGGSAVRSAYQIVNATTTKTFAPTLGTSRAYVANVLSFKLSTTGTTHSIIQAYSAFAGLNYTFRVCIDANTHKNARVWIGDSASPGFSNGVYFEVDSNAGVVLTQGTVVGTATIVSTNFAASLVSGIWVATICVQVPSATTLYSGVSMLSDAGALTWVGDGVAGGLYLSQWQFWQGIDDGRAYAQTTSVADEPVIFNPPHVLNPAGPAVWAAVAGGPFWGGANVWTSIDGTDYEMAGTIDAPARYGVLTANYASGADPDTTDTLSVDLGASNGSLSTATDATADNGGTLCLIDGELINFSTATLTNPNRYNLTTYTRRGYLNSGVSAHALGAYFVRLDDTVFQLPYFATNIGQTVSVKFQSFNLWGGGLQSLEDCIPYSATPTPVGATSPFASAWAAVGAVLSNAGQSIPAIVITGANDNPSAMAVIFYYRQTGQTSWISAGQHPATTVGYNITSVASGQSYDVGVSYLVNGVVGAISVIAANITVGSQSSGYSPGSTILNTSTAGTFSGTLPAGSYTHIDAVETGCGAPGYYAGGGGCGGGTTAYGASGGSTAVRAGIAVTPGTTPYTYTLSNTPGTPSTLTIGAVTLSCPTGIAATSSGSGAAPAAATGGTNNFAGHAGGITNAYSGGGSWAPTNPATNVTTGGYTDQNTLNQPGTVPGGGASGAGAAASSNLLFIARA